MPQWSQHYIDSANFSGASYMQRPCLHISCDTMMSAMHRADLHATQCPAGLHSAARSCLPCQPMCRPFSSPALRAQAATHPHIRHIQGNRLGRCQANFLDVAWGVTGDLSAQVALHWTRAMRAPDLATTIFRRIRRQPQPDISISALRTLQPACSASASYHMRGSYII